MANGEEKKQTKALACEVGTVDEKLIESVEEMGLDRLPFLVSDTSEDESQEIFKLLFGCGDKSTKDKDLLLSYFGGDLTFEGRMLFGGINEGKEPCVLSSVLEQEAEKQKIKDIVFSSKNRDDCVDYAVESFVKFSIDNYKDNYKQKKENFCLVYDVDKNGQKSLRGVFGAYVKQTKTYSGAMTSTSTNTYAVKYLPVVIKNDICKTYVEQSKQKTEGLSF